MEKLLLQPSCAGTITEILSVDFDGTGMSSYGPFFRHFTGKKLVILTRPVADSPVLLQHITDNIAYYRQELPSIPGGNVLEVARYFSEEAPPAAHQKAIELFYALFYSGYANSYRLIFSKAKSAP